MVEEVLKILMVEDDYRRVVTFNNWLPPSFRIVEVQNGGSALGLLERDRGYVYSGICLDHDLDMRNKCANDNDLSGSDVVKAIIKHISRNVPILIHSMNPKAAPRMGKMLLNAGFDVTRIPMWQLDGVLLADWLEEVKEEWAGNHEK